MEAEAEGPSSSTNSPRVWTIGHSTRAVDEFTDALLAHSIFSLADVRSFPGSRRYPQFGKVALSQSLASAGIEYVHLAKLGGRRPRSPNSKNVAWRNESFRAYADYMETEEFKQGIEALLEIARRGRTAIMCAESVWWRCHRGLIADYLKANGSVVTHIFDDGHSQEHPYTTAARIVAGKLSYEGLFT